MIYRIAWILLIPIDRAAIICPELRKMWIAPGNPQLLSDIAQIVGELDLSGLTGEPWLAVQRTMEGVATALERRGRHAQALMLCDRILEREPADPALLTRTLATKARSLHAVGLCPAALECIQQALEIEPESRHLADERATILAATERVGRG